jgi:hypothetical protein
MTRPVRSSRLFSFRAQNELEIPTTCDKRGVLRVSAYNVVTLLAVAANTNARPPTSAAPIGRRQHDQDERPALLDDPTWCPQGGPGALALLVGIGVPLIGIAASIGLVLFFVSANVAHTRTRWYSVLPVVFLVPAAGSLGLRLPRLECGHRLVRCHGVIAVPGDDELIEPVLV